MIISGAPIFFLIFMEYLPGGVNSVVDVMSEKKIDNKQYIATVLNTVHQGNWNTHICKCVLKFCQLTKFQFAAAYLMLLKFCTLDKTSIVTVNTHNYMEYNWGLHPCHKL